jgi:hypothetical protein
MCRKLGSDWASGVRCRQLMGYVLMVEPLSFLVTVQVMCNANKILWNVCANQPTGVHDGEQFKNSSFYRSLGYHMIFARTYDHHWRS